MNETRKQHVVDAKPIIENMRASSTTTMGIVACWSIGQMLAVIAECASAPEPWLRTLDALLLAELDEPRARALGLVGAFVDPERARSLGLQRGWLPARLTSAGRHARELLTQLPAERTPRYGIRILRRCEERTGT